MIEVRPTIKSSNDPFLARWREIVDDASLQDLPYKIETDEWGRIILSPATNRHSLYAFLVAEMLKAHKQNGIAFTEASVLTRKGVRVPDAIWASNERIADLDDVFSLAPEICVEVTSKSNADEEIAEKTELYFAAGALEVWTCDLEGNVKFADPDGVLNASKLVPEFPSRVDLKR